MLKFYRNLNGKVIPMEESSVNDPSLIEVIPNTTDAAVEKHVPVVEINDNKVTVTVGSVLHPMLDVHYIEWIILETDRGFFFYGSVNLQQKIKCMNLLNDLL